MKFNRGSHTRILDDLTVSFDPTDSTVELGIRDADGAVTWYEAEWLDEPAQILDDPPTWLQTAQTLAYFAGPDGEPVGATVLDAGRHFTVSRITAGQDIVVGPSSAIDVG